jgi:CheY-like chemotaxis protein
MNAFRILIVEDNATLRGIYANVLSRAGYLVHTEADAEGALRAVGMYGCFAVALLDYRLPGRSGGALGFELEALCPRMPILFVTGYSAPEDLPGRVVLQKPVLPAQLLEAVEALLREPPVAE